MRYISVSVLSPAMVVSVGIQLGLSHPLPSASRSDNSWGDMPETDYTHGMHVMAFKFLPCPALQFLPLFLSGTIPVVTWHCCWFVIQFGPVGCSFPCPMTKCFYRTVFVLGLNSVWTKRCSWTERCSAWLGPNNRRTAGPNANANSFSDLNGFGALVTP